MLTKNTSRRHLLTGILAGGALSLGASQDSGEPIQEITTAVGIDLPDPLRKITMRVVKEVGLAIEKTVAHEAEPRKFPLPPDPDSMEQIMWQRFRTLTPAQRQRAVLKATLRLQASDSVRRRLLGDLADINLRSSIPIAQQVDALPYPQNLRISVEYLRNFSRLPSAERTVATRQLAAQTAARAVALRIHKVKCVDETNGSFVERFGNDEILLGATSVDETGDTNKIPHFTVGSNFDDGESKTFSPYRTLTSFSLLEGTAFPKYYNVTLVLSEKDGGGTADFINKLFLKVKEKVIAAITAAVGGFIGISGGPVGAAIGAAIGLAVGIIWDLLKKAIDDDPFPLKTVWVAIPSRTHRFSFGRLDSPQGVVRFDGNDGLYELTYDWQLIT